MTDVNTAIQNIEKYTLPLGEENCKLDQALGQILAQDIKASINMPPFRQSSMDGYALRKYDGESYEIVGEVAAGKSIDTAIKPGQAVRIFTGARVPDDADRVVMQEHTEKRNQNLQVTKMPKAGQNIRPIGEQVKASEVVMAKGSLMTEAGIGFLTGLGVENIHTYKKPKISILITGNELQEVWKPLAPGQVYESNAITLKLALARVGHFDAAIVKVPDSLQETVDAIKNALTQSDLILISGGISVGDYDFVRTALHENDVTEIFYKVNQKPGKPLWYGHNEKKQLFGLPGNPASSLSCFYVYVRYALSLMMGSKKSDIFQLKARTTQQISNPFRKVLFLKATVVNGSITPLDAQASSMLRSFAVSNALAVIPAEVSELPPGSEISYIAL